MLWPGNWQVKKSYCFQSHCVCRLQLLVLVMLNLLWNLPGLTLGKEEIVLAANTIFFSHLALVVAFLIFFTDVGLDCFCLLFIVCRIWQYYWVPEMPCSADTCKDWKLLSLMLVLFHTTNSMQKPYFPFVHLNRYIL